MTREKPLSERIAARVKRINPTKGGKNRAAFLAVKDEVAAALADGWSVAVIWGTLHEEGKIAYGYETFNRYVGALIRRSAAASSPPPPSVTSPMPSSTAAPVSQPEKPADRRELPGFNFNPSPKKEDLI